MNENIGPRFGLVFFLRVIIKSINQLYIMNAGTKKSSPQRPVRIINLEYSLFKI
jgi:hypothetical protein